MSASGSTRSETARRDSSRPVRAGQIYLVLSCHAPTAPPARISLDGLDEVTVGRGAARRIERKGRRVVVELDDPWLSGAHARFVRRLSAWVLHDEGSKNGSIVNGRIQGECALRDGDVVELGRTFLLHRTEVDVQPGDARIATGGIEPVPGLPTLAPALAAGLDGLARVAPTRVPILLRGESGTGKELAARSVHALSGRGGPLVAVNCGALPDALVESELFGHKKGAFSGATEERHGFIRAADRGTLFLDEIGDLSGASQAALLRALQENEVTPIGSTRPISVDVRVVTATHRDLDRLVETGRFRRDLFARIAGFQLDLPPLRARREDLGLLVAALLSAAGRERAGAITLHPTFVRAIFSHRFPGNIRELEKCLSSAVALAGVAPITIDHAPTWFTGGLARGPEPVLDEEDRRLRGEIVDLLRRHRGNVAAVARRMGKARTQVQRWIKRYGITREERNAD